MVLGYRENIGKKTSHVDKTGCRSYRNNLGKFLAKVRHYLMNLSKDSRHSESMGKVLVTSKTIGKPRLQCQLWKALYPSDNLGNAIVPSENIGKL